MEISEFQSHIENVYGEKDRERGVAMSVAWLAEEVGELAQAIRKGTHDQRLHELEMSLRGYFRWQIKLALMWSKP